MIGAGLIFVPVKTGLLLIVVCVSVVFGGLLVVLCLCFLVGMVGDGGTSMERLNASVFSRVCFCP